MQIRLWQFGSTPTLGQIAPELLVKPATFYKGDHIFSQNYKEISDTRTLYTYSLHFAFGGFTRRIGFC